MVRFAVTCTLACSLLLTHGGCSDDSDQIQNWPDGLGSGGDLSVFPDAALPNDLGQAPDLAYDEEGPAIEILAPTEGAVVVGNVLKVQAKISDPDGIDDQTVEVTLQSKEPLRMTITTTPDVYQALIDIAGLGEKARLWVTASDLKGHGNSQLVDFSRDPGPQIVFLSPEEESRHRGSVSVQVVVTDSKPITSFALTIGSHPLTLTQNTSDPLRQIWSGTVKFDDDNFNPPLSGLQVLTATAVNENQAKTVAQRRFYVDDKGPRIDVASHAPGDLIGGIIEIAVTVTDLAGVLPSTVRCVIGNNLDAREVELRSSDTNPNDYTGQFDTRTLSQYDLWPVMSFRAADMLGNESHYDMQVGLDNGQPLAELDPPDTYYLGREKDGLIECSHPFDPVGSDAVSDLQQVPQVIKIRARIQDQGNHVRSAPWIPISLVDDDTTWLYVLDDTSKALAVDTDGDGYCDDINPEVIPLGSTPQAGEAVAVNLAPVPPGGGGDFTYPGEDAVLHPACDMWGTESNPPDELCLTTSATVAISYTYKNEPAIYTIPPISGVGKTLNCLGLPFDFQANNFQEGWVCAGVVADDNLGNRGVSPLLRLYVNYDSIVPGDSLPAGAGAPPHCTGTLDRASGVVDSSKPCVFRNPRDTSNCDPNVEFPQQFCSMTLVIP